MFDRTKGFLTGDYISDWDAVNEVVVLFAKSLQDNDCPHVRIVVVVDVAGEKCRHRMKMRRDSRQPLTVL